VLLVRLAFVGVPFEAVPFEAALAEPAFVGVAFEAVPFETPLAELWPLIAHELLLLPGRATLLLALRMH
jgi:hypothetical protein